MRQPLHLHGHRPQLSTHISHGRAARPAINRKAREDNHHTRSFSLAATKFSSFAPRCSPFYPRPLGFTNFYPLYPTASTLRAPAPQAARCRPPSARRLRPPSAGTAKAYFALKGTQTKRSATPRKKHEAKGDAPGLKSSGVSLISGSEGSN